MNIIHKITKNLKPVGKHTFNNFRIKDIFLFPTMTVNTHFNFLWIIWAKKNENKEDIMLVFKRKFPPSFSYPIFHKMWAKSHKTLYLGSPRIEDGIFILTAFQSYLSAHNEEPLAVPCSGYLQRALNPVALKLSINIICLWSPNE